MIETWDFTYPLYLDVARPDAPLLNGLSSSPLQQPVVWVQSDSFPLRLHFRKRGAIQSASSPVALPEELSIVLGGRRRNNSQITGPLLVFSNTFTPDATETDAWYETTLNLHTAELDALIASVNGPVTLQIDIEVGERLTYVVPVTILPEAYQGEGDPPPTLAGPGYAIKSASIDWESSDEVLVSIPDPMLVESIHLSSSADTQADFELGTPADPDRFDIDAQMQGDRVRLYSVHQIVTGGSIRFRIYAEDTPSTGHIIIKGVKL